MAAPVPSFSDTIQMYVGIWGAGRATASSDIIDLCNFPTLPGQSGPVQFTPADVGCPIMIVGAGAVNANMPPIFNVQGATLKSHIIAYISPTSVQIADTATTHFYNSGFNNVCVFRACGMLTDSWTFQESITQSVRDTLTFTALRTDPYFTRMQVMLEGQPVLLRSTDTAVGDLFGGLIDSLDVTNQVQAPTGGFNPATNAAGTQPFAYIAQCVSWDSITSRRIVEPQYAQVLTGTADQVMSKLVLMLTSDEGVNVITPVVGPTITLPVPQGAVLQKLMDDVATLAGTATTAWFWKFDAWRNVTFATNSTTAAPFNVEDTDGSDDNVLVAVTVNKSHAQYYNKFYGLGKSVLVGQVTCKFIGDGTTQTFNAPEALGGLPTITLNGSGQTVGVLGVDTGKEWYWSQGTTTITQDTGGTPLAATDTLTVVYAPAVPAVSVAFNNAGLQDRAVVEGPGAVYESAINVNDFVTPAELLADASEAATQQGLIPQTVKATTVRGGLRTGQLQHITLADIAVDDDFLITQVRLTSTNNLLSWDYQAMAGYAIPSWLTAFTQFINRTNPNTVGVLTPATPFSQAPTATGGNYAIGLAGAGGSPPLAFPQTVNKGDLIFVVQNSASTQPSDSQGNTYVLAKAHSWGGGGFFPPAISVWYTFASATGSVTVSLAVAWISIGTIQNVDPSNPIDTTGGADTSGPTITVGQAGNIVLTAFGADSGGTAPTVTAPETITGYELGLTQGSIATAIASPGAGSFTSSLVANSARPAFVSVAFKAAPATAPPAPATTVAGNPQGTVTHTGVLTADLPVLGNGGADIDVGVAGQLVPAGGSTGQVLAKNSGTDYDAGWTPAGGLSVTTKGDLQGYSTTPARVAVGSDGQVLTADSTASTGVSWKPAVGGGLTLIEQHTASSSAELDFTSCISSAYDEYLIEVVNLIPATNNVDILLEVSTNGGSSYDQVSGHYSWSTLRWFNATFSGAAGGADANINLGSGFQVIPSAAAPGGLTATLRLYNPLSATAHKAVSGRFNFEATSVGFQVAFELIASYIQTAAINAFRLRASSGNLASGTVRVYGLGK